VAPVVEVDVDGRTRHGNELSGLVAHRELAISVSHHLFQQSRVAIFIEGRVQFAEDS